MTTEMSKETREEMKALFGISREFIRAVLNAARTSDNPNDILLVAPSYVLAELAKVVNMPEAYLEEVRATAVDFVLEAQAEEADGATLQ